MHFLDQKNPVLRRGSKKWKGVQRWGWYVGLFFSISIGEQASLAMSPLEFLSCWEREPHLMAILTTVQGRVRHKIAEKMAKVTADGHKPGNLRARTPAKR